jgi:hemerythrin-like domain-containing protein
VKRSEELTPLSHDHHQALFVALQLSRAEDQGEVARTFLEFWDGKGAAHFRIEEELLVPGWLASAPEADRELAARMAAEHLEIRAAARRIGTGEVSLEELRAIGDLLREHVRFEERLLFPRIEADLDRAALARLGAEIDAAEAELP